MSRTSVFLVVVILTVVATTASSKSIDEIIMESATSSAQFDFFPGGETEGDVQVELDMLYTKERWTEIQKMRNARRRGGRSKRKAVRPENFRWPSGVIPYDFQSPGTFSSSERAQIDLAIQEWNNYTCVSLRPATSADRNRITFQDGGGCSSFVGRIPRSSQAVTLARGCRVKGVIVHEIGHAVGFNHEQTRPDRDRFVSIVEANIPPNVLFNFQRYSDDEVNNFDVPYDFSSVMHYGPRAFSVNGGFTIVTKDPAFQNVIGNREGLSFRDIKLANIIYNCGGSCGRITCPGEGFVGKDCRCYCPGSPIRLCEGSTGGGSTGGGSTGNGSTGGGSETCRNMNSNCEFWAGRGECDRNPNYMKVFCRPACNVCTGMGCQDMHERCARWAELGFCQGRFQTYMSATCPVSCDTCPTQDTTSLAGGSSANNGSGDNSGNTGCRHDLTFGAILVVLMTAMGLFS